MMERKRKYANDKEANERRVAEEENRQRENHREENKRRVTEEEKRKREQQEETRKRERQEETRKWEQQEETRKHEQQEETRKRKQEETRKHKQQEETRKWEQEEERRKRQTKDDIEYKEETKKNQQRKLYESRHAPTCFGEPNFLKTERTDVYDQEFISNCCETTIFKMRQFLFDNSGYRPELKQGDRERYINGLENPKLFRTFRLFTHPDKIMMHGQKFDTQLTNRYAELCKF